MRKSGADVHAVAKGMGLDGASARSFFIRARFWRLMFPQRHAGADQNGPREIKVTSRIVEAVVEVNSAQKARMIAKIRAALGGESGKTIAVLGLTFKPETDDMRDAPSLAILPALLDKGAPRACS
ncbi:MAG: hypothetical protein CM15mP89_4620 [Gammaproteobacteria bacterium]|nr:MAG: hypothetical protein CM15mP89_4620 [Gammaproteobacteria bacterium]